MSKEENQIFFCCSPIWDFDKCPIERQKGCNSCSNNSDNKPEIYQDK